MASLGADTNIVIETGDTEQGFAFRIGNDATQTPTDLGGGEAEAANL